MQSKLHSFLETFLNILSGMIIAFVISQLAHVYESEIQRYVWNGFVWKVGATSNVVMTVVLTIVSMIRGYSWRRFFNTRSRYETTKK